MFEHEHCDTIVSQVANRLPSDTLVALGMDVLDTGLTSVLGEIQLESSRYRALLRMMCNLKFKN